MVNWYRRGQVLPTRHRLYQKARTHRSQQSILLQLFFATQVLHLRVRNLGLACKIGTFLGPNLDFGPIWDQVPNLGLHYSACLLLLHCPLWLIFSGCDNICSYSVTANTSSWKLPNCQNINISARLWTLNIIWVVQQSTKVVQLSIWTFNLFWMVDI